MNVLAVDDSQTIRDMVTMALNGAGFKTTTANDGVHGLEVLSDMEPDVIITDINMPRMDGFGFIDGVRKKSKYKGIPILVLTTENSNEMKLRAREAGATGWIVKPFEPQQLVNALHKVAGA